MCPFCEEKVGKQDDKFKLSANPTVVHPDDGTRGAWTCWRCETSGWGGLDFLDEPEAARPEQPKPVVDLGPPQGFVPFRGNETSVVLENYRRYVRARGVYEYVEAIGGGACLTGFFAERVVVPHVVGKKWAGFSARAVGAREPKYLYPRGMDRRNGLWGLEWVPGDQEPVWVVEGVFDALPLFPYGVATFGKSVTAEQVEVLAALERPVVVCLDGDAWTECRSLAYRLAMRRGGRATSWAKLPPTTDPGVLGWGVKSHVVTL